MLWLVTATLGGCLATVVSLCATLSLISATLCFLATLWPITATLPRFMQHFFQNTSPAAHKTYLIIVRKVDVWSIFLSDWLGK